MFLKRLKDRGAVHNIRPHFLVLGNEFGHQIQHPVEKALRDNDNTLKRITKDDISLQQE
jgi:hypothetical protein